MKILVTGAQGFIGRALTARLLREGHAVHAAVRNIAEAKRAFAAFAAFAALNNSPVEARCSALRLSVVALEDEEALRAAAAEFKPEVCVHLAGRSAVREAVREPELYARVNVGGTTAVLEAARRAGCRRVVFPSTVMVYGADAPTPYREDTPGQAPASPYGASKLAAEVFLRAYGRLYDMETVIPRLFSVYGPFLRSDLVPHLIAAAVLEQRPFTVFGDGSSKRDYLELDDAVEALYRAAVGEIPWEGAEKTTTLNIGSGRPTELRELIAGLERALGQKAILQYEPPRPGELAAAWADVSRAEKFLGWRPRVSLDEGLARLAEWFKASRG